ncbi:hypothetical protein E6H36_06640 [Candidatus Bathyarchaeota archaeon]|nr:MAG: hypothetical protein E6H36_06640 [Candidatus Bathyarchaeota archaeon]TMI33036.1 MAG: hypothetical protein E6H29_01215 [Candidatus Bathyarchaeota archaeon]
MLQPVPMRLVSIIIPRERLHNLLAYAGDSEILHLVEVAGDHLPPGASKYDIASVLAHSSPAKSKIAALNSALGTADLPLEKIDAPVESLDSLAAFLGSECSRLEQPVKQLEESAGKLQAERERSAELSRFLSGLKNAGVPLSSLAEGSFLSTVAGEVAVESAESLRQGIADVTYGNMIFAVTASTEDTQTFLSLFPSAFAEEAKQAASALGAKLDAAWADLPTDLDEATKQVSYRMQEIETSEKKLEQDRQTFVEEQGPRIKALSALAELLDVRTKAIAGSPTTESTVMLQAWVPEYRVEELSKGVAEACQGEASVVAEEVGSSESKTHPESKSIERSETSGDEDSSKPPTLVNTPSWFKPVQSIINNFGIPNYNELNPLPFMIISYPLIFGLMFGDFGQGPLFILFGLLFMRVRKKGGKIPGGDIGQLIVGGAELMILLGIGTTIFGFVFGDFFGFESAQIFGIHPIFSPTEGALTGTIDHLQTFMVYILYFGVAHYTLGLALNAYQKIRRKEYSEAFFGPICWALFYLAFVDMVRTFALAGYKFSAVLSNPIPIALFVIPFGLLSWKEGGLHALEAFTSMGSNTLSYLRIWALNIADFFVKVALFTAFGIGGAIGGNILVMIIEGLIVFVQTLRLHWVEWFSKFYEGNGLPFAPYWEPKGWIVQTRGS